MRGLFIKNKSEKVTVAAYNFYGAQFKINIFNQEVNEYIQTDIEMQEGVEPVEDFSSKTSEDRTKGQEVISINDEGLNPNERVQVGNFIYRVASVDGTNITLHKGLREDILADTDVIRVGNMGAYSADITVDQVGPFLIQAKDTIFGLLHTDSISVAQQSVQEMLKDINTSVEETEELLTTTKRGWKVLV